MCICVSVSVCVCTRAAGKQFFVGLWEGDSSLRNPSQPGKRVDPVVGRIQTLTKVVQQKQRAVDNAKKNFASCREVGGGCSSAGTVRELSAYISCQLASGYHVRQACDAV